MLPLLMLTLLICEPAFSGERLLPSSQELAQAIQEAEKINQQAKQLLGQSNIKDIFGNLSTNKGCPQQILNQRSSQNCPKKLPDPIQGKNKILVFVSFSMPEASLKSLFQEAPLHNAVLVMRGLGQDSFVKTALKLQELGITVDIHPELFETHHVTSVPTFVRLEDGQPMYSLKGNITLNFVVKTFESQKVEEAP